MSTLLDTNILTRIAQPAHRQHGLALGAVDLLLANNEQICIVPQNLYEFWAVATRPAAANGLDMSVAEARAELARIKGLFTLHQDDEDLLPQWEHLVHHHDVKGKTAHDARLVAAMRRHGLTRLLTFNASHFMRFTGITVLTPEAVLANGG